MSIRVCGIWRLVDLDEAVWWLTAMDGFPVVCCVAVQLKQIEEGEHCGPKLQWLAGSKPQASRNHNYPDRPTS